MLKKRPLLSDERLAKLRKPQYKILDAVKRKAIGQLATWFLEEYELPGCHARTLSEEIISRVITQKKEAIDASAPDVFLSEASVLEGILIDAQKLALEMDRNDELDEILENEARQEEREKYGI